MLPTGRDKRPRPKLPKLLSQVNRAVPSATTSYKHAETAAEIPAATEAVVVEDNEVVANLVDQTPRFQRRITRRVGQRLVLRLDCFQKIAGCHNYCGQVIEKRWSIGFSG